MDLSIQQVSGILAKSEDEVMFLVQSNKLSAGVDEDSLTWRFSLDDVLKTKAELEENDEE